MKKTATRDFIASVNNDYADRMEEIADRLRDKGCRIKQVLKLTGIITGSIGKTTALDDLKIEGIQSVELQKNLRKI